MWQCWSTARLWMISTFELDRHQSMLGNIYKGKVESILPSINSAFVNIGQEKNGFLYLTDADNPFLNDIEKIGRMSQSQAFLKKS